MGRKTWFLVAERVGLIGARAGVRVFLYGVERKWWRVVDEYVCARLCV
jgi:hypothetical protein